MARKVVAREQRSAMVEAEKGWLSQEEDVLKVEGFAPSWTVCLLRKAVTYAKRSEWRLSAICCNASERFPSFMVYQRGPS